MKILLRIFLVFLVVAVFSITAVLIIALAKGYRYDFKKGIIRKTGLIIFASRPSGDSIYINNQLISQKTGSSLFPSKVDGLDPGNYNLKVTQDGYLPWEKKVEIKPELVSWANYILLIPTSPFINQLSKGTITNFKLSPDKRTIAYIAKDQNNQSRILLLDISNSKVTSLNYLNIAKEEVASLIWSPDSNFLLLRFKDKIILADLGSQKTTFFNLISLAFFNPGSSKEIFVLDNQTLYKTSPWEEKNSAILERQVSYFEIQNGKIYYTQSANHQNKLFSMDFDGGNKQEITSLLLGKIYKMSYSEQLNSLAVATQDNALFLISYKNGQTIITQIRKAIKGAAWSKNGEKLLYWGDNFAYVYDFQNQEEKEFLLFDNLKIDDVGWYFDSSHFWLVTSGVLKIGDFDGNNLIKLADVKIPKVEFLEDYLSFFYADKNGLNILKLEPK